MNGGGWRRYLRPLVPVYAGLIDGKERMVARKWLKQRRLGHPVISVGSLSAGGAGKTPVVVMLAELLCARGFEVRILTRGYRRSGSGIERVRADGDAGRLGDEPVMMARHLASRNIDAAVWVGADRFRAGKLSEQNDLPGRKVLYLLDDGFQHRKLARDIDVVLLTRQDLTDTLLPEGNLRESLKAVLRADVVVLREEDGFAGGISGKAATWFIQRDLRLPDGVPMPHGVIAFCGLARPEGFFAMLKTAGIEVAGTLVFRDHHTYTAANINDLQNLAKAHGADGFVTTQKDSVKLDETMRGHLKVVGPLLVAELSVSLRDQAAKLEDLVRLIEAKLASRDLGQ